MCGMSPDIGLCDLPMKISVVTVCYNSVNVIEETINSVLEQTYGNVEYIIIDGGSTDGTVDIIKKYADRLAYWISERDKGIYDAMNKGIAVATGDYINFMNAGDFFAHYSIISDICSNINGDTDIAFGDTFLKFKTRCMLRKPLSLSAMSTKPPFCHQSTFIKSTFHKAHLFDISYRIVADYDFFYNSYFNWNAKFQYISTGVAVYDCAEGVSTDNLRSSLLEKFRVWGIDRNWIKQLPWRISLLRSVVSHKLKKHLSAEIVISIKKFIDSTRSHVK